MAWFISRLRRVRVCPGQNAEVNRGALEGCARTFSRSLGWLFPGRDRLQFDAHSARISSRAFARATGFDREDALGAFLWTWFRRRHGLRISPVPKPRCSNRPD